MSKPHPSRREAALARLSTLFHEGRLFDEEGEVRYSAIPGSVAEALGHELDLILEEMRLDLLYEAQYERDRASRSHDLF